VQQPGRYRLEQRPDARFFAWAYGPQAFKTFLFASRESLWRVQRDAQGSMTFSGSTPETPRWP